jgi:hypothetical protein
MQMELPKLHKKKAKKGVKTKQQENQAKQHKK